jgi:hypothetical protein
LISLEEEKAFNPKLYNGHQLQCKMYVMQDSVIKKMTAFQYFRGSVRERRWVFIAVIVIATTVVGN